MSVKSCPDWLSLVSHRQVRDQEEPPGWRQAVEHLQSCARCQSEAVAADPTLVFARLPRIETSGDEVAAMRQAVRHLRRGRYEIGPNLAWARSSLSQWSTTPFSGWLLRAATVAFTVLVLALAPATTSRSRVSPGGEPATGHELTWVEDAPLDPEAPSLALPSDVADRTPSLAPYDPDPLVVQSSTRSDALSAAGYAASLADLRYLPPVEAVGPNPVRLYLMADDVVMIVDETLHF